MISEVVRAHQALASAGQTDLIWGHVSVRDPEGRGFWMKTAGWGFAEVNAQRVILVSPSGEILSGTGKCHLEYPIHAEILRCRPDVHCVVHTHAMAANAFSSLDVPLRALSHDGVLFTDPQIPRFTRTGGLIKTAGLGAELANTLGDALACLLPRHGLVTAGKDAAHAVMYAVLLERACQVQLSAMAAGGSHSWSDAAEVSAKRDECWPDSQINAGWDHLIRTFS